MDTVAQAFSERTSLKRQIEECIQEAPKYSNLFRDIASYVNELRNRSANDSGPSTKKRKLDGSSATNGSGGWADASSKPVHSAPDVSFSLPARKKLTLQILDGPNGGLRAVDASGGGGSSSGSIEFGIGWQDVSQVFRLPVPEKQRRAWNYVVIPRANTGLAAAGEGAPEQILWTHQEPTAKERAAAAAAGAGTPDEPAHTTALLDARLAPLGRAVVVPAEADFASALPQSHRRGEPAFHVRAFRGSKDGFLFFLSAGIVFGFKKPLLFFGLADVASISYTSVQRVTFNVVVATARDGEEFEFAMLDQADFAGIDAYVRARGLNDASLAADRAAKVYHANKARKAAGDGDGDGDGEDVDDEATELQKAEQQLQDDEDEMEEDFDPDAGESDSGSSDEEEYEADGADSEGAASDAEVGDGEEEADDDDDDGDDDVVAEEDEEEPEAAVPQASFSVVNRQSAVRVPEEPEGGFL